MIRLNKPVKLLEWGEGVNTLNQIWEEIGEGHIVKDKSKDGLTTLTIRLKDAFSKKNLKDKTIKIVQPGEGMTACSQMWGEVAIGYLPTIEPSLGKAVIEIEIPTATKIDKRK